MEENIEKIPDGTAIFEVDFDVHKSLAEKYDVLSQTTVLFFDGSGELIDRAINPSVDRTVKALSGVE